MTGSNDFRYGCLAGTAAAMAALGTCACSFQAAAPFEPLPAPAILLPLDLSDVTDARGAFRSTLCKVAGERKGKYPDERPCKDMLHDFGGEMAGAAQPVVAHRAANILIVPGVFGECVAEQVTPFSDGAVGDGSRKTERPYAYVEDFGYRVDVARVRGRASSEANAPIVKDAMLGMAADGKPLIVIAYSKGVPDTMEALRQLGLKGIPGNLRAVVSVAGVVAGTPIADGMDHLYESVLSHIPFPGCARMPSDPVASLSRAERLRKLQAELAAVPDTVKLYSLVSVAKPENVTAALRPFHKLLSASDPRNDGQVLYYDAVLPRSRLLGYVNSDHWAFALAFNRADRPFWRSLIDHNAFPREVLLEAILLQVQSDMPR